MALRYVVLAAEPATLQDLARKFEPIIGQGASEVVMTLGERLIEQGRQQGRQQGLVEGEAKGRVEGEARGRVEAQAEALLRVLAARNLVVSDDLLARIRSCRDLAVLGRWLDRAVTAQSTAEALSAG
jgi:flagellar biosynthesis/type III secretory pathway protein FliH